MIAYLEGRIAHRSPTHIYVDVNGVAYLVLISLTTYAELEEKDKVRIYTHLMVREDSQTLYGFYTEEEKEVFALLISVSGIGGNSARVILSYLNPEEVKQGILQENVPLFNKVKGVGPKTAKRIILDLKDKVAKMGVETKVVEHAELNDNSFNEALSALVSLGFQKTLADKKLKNVIKDSSGALTVEDMIKEVLKQIS